MIDDLDKLLDITKQLEIYEKQFDMDSKTFYIDYINFLITPTEEYINWYSLYKEYINLYEVLQ